MNPALNTRWCIKKDGLLFQFTIVGIWGSGFLNNYRVTSYEVQYDHIDKIQVIPAEKIKELITEEQIKAL
jgi:hypothetical protein